MCRLTQKTQISPAIGEGLALLIVEAQDKQYFIVVDHR